MDDIIHYISKNSLPENIKLFIQSKKSIIEKNHKIYLKYADFFCENSDNQNLDANFIKKINIAGFFYYLSIVKQDETFDVVRDINEKYIYEQLLISNFQEETIKILSI